MSIASEHLEDKIDELLKELNQWKEAARSEAQMLNEERVRSQILIEALESIAFYDEPSADEAEFWMKKKHQNNAETMATDTHIARTALDKYKGE